MHLKTFSAISPEFFFSIIKKENFFSRQAWKVVNRAGNGLLINELEKILKAKLTIYELDDYDDEEDTYWKLKIGETRNPEIKKIRIRIITWRPIHAGAENILYLRQ